jgi:hypothetical protein
MRQDSCHDCGSKPGETPFSAEPRRRGTPRLCLDCQAERARVAERGTLPTAALQTRASYRAAFRHRQGQAQMDLVDLVMPRP